MSATERTEPSGSSRGSARSEAPIVAGTAAGVVAWLGGYVFTYVVAAGEIRNSGLNRIVEALSGDAATYEIVGWVFYNAHFVDTVFNNLPIVGSITANYVGGEDGFTAGLYAIPIALLCLGGAATAAYTHAADATSGIRAGVVLVPGYLLATVASVFLFEVTTGSASAGPDPLAAIVLAGIVYPIVFGSIGGAAVGWYLDRQRDRGAAAN